MKRAFFIALALLIAFLLGRSLGVQHAMSDAEHWILEIDYTDEDKLPYGDFTLISILDGHAYENYGYIG